MSNTPYGTAVWQAVLRERPSHIILGQALMDACVAEERANRLREDWFELDVSLKSKALAIATSAAVEPWSLTMMSEDTAPLTFDMKTP